MIEIVQVNIKLPKPKRKPKFSNNSTYLVRIFKNFYLNLSYTKRKQYSVLSIIKS